MGFRGAIFDVDGVLIEASEFHEYPDAPRFVLAVRDAGLRIGAASSYKLTVAARPDGSSQPVQVGAGERYTFGARD